MNHTQRGHVVSWGAAVGIALIAAWMSLPPELPSFLLGFSFVLVLNAFFGDSAKRNLYRLIIMPLAAGFSVVGVHHIVGLYMFQM